MAKDNGIKVRDLEPGQYVVFINTHKDRVKVFAAGNVIAYAKLEQGRRVDLNVIQHIPRVFQATGNLNYDKALEAALQTSLARRARATLHEKKENIQ